MITLHIEGHDGGTREIAVAPEGTLMEAIRGHGFDELLAQCGGCCSCATCHVVIDDASLSKLTGMSPDEDSLLDGSEHRLEGSRLSCQIPLSSDLHELKLRIAAMDWTPDGPASSFESLLFPRQPARRRPYSS